MSGIREFFNYGKTYIIISKRPCKRSLFNCSNFTQKIFLKSLSQSRACSIVPFYYSSNLLQWFRRICKFKARHYNGFTIFNACFSSTSNSGYFSYFLIRLRTSSFCHSGILAVSSCSNASISCSFSFLGSALIKSTNWLNCKGRYLFVVWTCCEF